MRILLFIRSLDIGGAERQVVNLARTLKKRGHDVAVMVLYSDGPFKQDLIDASIPILSVEKTGRYDLWNFLINLISEVKAFEPSILYSFLPTQNILSLIVKLFQPRLKIVWGIRASNMDLNNYDWLASFFYKLEKLFLRCPKRIITNSKAALPLYYKKSLHHKLVYIPNGIDTTVFSPNPKAREKTRKSLDIDQKKTLIGLVARLDPMKDHLTFFKALALLKNKTANFSVICVGDGSKAYRDTLTSSKEFQEIKSKLQFIPHYTPLKDFYNALDISVLSSSYGEGFPNTIAEAMACGTVCIATNVGDAKDIVSNNGMIVPPHEPQLLADALYKIISGKAKFDPRSIRSHIIENFSCETLAQKTEDILDSVK